MVWTQTNEERTKNEDERMTNERRTPPTHCIPTSAMALPKLSASRWLDLAGDVVVSVGGRGGCCWGEAQGLEGGEKLLGHEGGSSLAGDREYPQAWGLLYRNLRLDAG